MRSLKQKWSLPRIGWRDTESNTGLPQWLRDEIQQAVNEIERLRRERFSFVTTITNDANRIVFLESLCEHEWKIQDDSFDHEFGTERVVYDECDICGATRAPTQD